MPPRRDPRQPRQRTMRCSAAHCARSARLRLQSRRSVWVYCPWLPTPDIRTLGPLQARYRWDLGLSLAASGDPRAGVAELQRAADFGETEPQLYVDLGDAERKLGDVATARRAYQQALVIDPFFAPAHQRLGELGA